MTEHTGPEMMTMGQIEAEAAAEAATYPTRNLAKARASVAARATEPASITTDGITVTATDEPGRFAVTGKRVDGVVSASLYIDERGGDEYRNGRRISVPTSVVTMWFGSRSGDDSRGYLTINGIDYVGSYAKTTGGRYVGASIDRIDSGKVTDNARALIHNLADAVATLHATPANVSARKLQDAEQAVAEADRKVAEATDVQIRARLALAKLQHDQAE